MATSSPISASPMRSRPRASRHAGHPGTLSRPRRRPRRRVLPARHRRRGRSIPDRPRPMASLAQRDHGGAVGRPDDFPPVRYARRAHPRTRQHPRRESRRTGRPTRPGKARHSDRLLAPSARPRAEHLRSSQVADGTANPGLASPFASTILLARPRCLRLCSHRPSARTELEPTWDCPPCGASSAGGSRPDLVIGLFPPWYAAPQPDWPPQLRLAGFGRFDGAQESLPDDVRTFCQAGSPPIAFTLGTGMKHAADFFRTAVAACDTLGARPPPHQIPRPDPTQPAPQTCVTALRPVSRAAPTLPRRRPPRRNRHHGRSPRSRLPTTRPTTRLGPTRQRRPRCQVRSRPHAPVTASQQRTNESCTSATRGSRRRRTLPRDRESSGRTRRATARRRVDRRIRAHGQEIEGATAISHLSREAARLPNLDRSHARFSTIRTDESRQKKVC